MKSGLRTYLKIGCYCGLSILMMGCLQDDPLDANVSFIEAFDNNDGIITSLPQSEGMDAEAMVDIYTDVINDEDLWSLRSMLVFRNNKLVTEAYPKQREDINNQYIVWSCTKQVMGLLVGMALDKGFISDIDDPISAYLNKELEGYDDKKNITIRQLLSMRSGIDYNNGEQSDELIRKIPDNSVEFILSRPMRSPPGMEFNYSDANPHLLSAIIQKQTGMTTREWAEEQLFSRIGLEKYSWIEYKDGITMGGFGIATTARDLSKLALLVLNKGTWFSNTIVSSDWINEMTQVQSQVDYLDYSFGYLWWIDESRDIHFMWGVGGQLVFIIPSKSMVVTFTAFPNTKGKYEIMPEEVLPYVDRLVDAAN